MDFRVCKKYRNAAPEVRRYRLLNGKYPVDPFDLLPKLRDRKDRVPCRNDRVVDALVRLIEQAFDMPLFNRVCVYSFREVYAGKSRT